ncbi:MAG: hypothetical protein METHP_00105 [Methanoregula sp. SKADARSKE-2]|jgi:hypothetical protein|nr:MAG: hypothetical protein METHP_00105 [Methanoregula sp. SKADARSKE-2]
MFSDPRDRTGLGQVSVAPEVIEYIDRRGCDFRVCTSCGGPILLPTRIKPQKKSDLLLRAGSHTIYVSIHQARFLNSIRRDMIPFFDSYETDGRDPDEF